MSSSARVRERYHTDPEFKRRILEQRKTYYERRKIRLGGSYSSVHRRYKYGITSEQFEELVKKQNGQCVICKTDKPGGKSNVWHIDHNHKTGRVRGLLCSGCNLGLGHFKESPRIMMEAIVYLSGE